MVRSYILVMYALFLIACSDKNESTAPQYQHPEYKMHEDLYMNFFREIQFLRQIPEVDFANAIPLQDPMDIVNLYRRAKNDADFDVKEFVSAHFILPDHSGQKYTPDKNQSIADHIEKMWTLLSRPADDNQDPASWLIPLPHPYAVSESTDNDIRYWDSYFIMLGLYADKKNELLENMVKNFAYLIDREGYVPYNNRKYNVSRSGPPVFADMLALLEKVKGDDVWKTYLPHLEKEYQYWMKATDALTATNIDSLHVVSFQDHTLNRYWDENVTPRPEYYTTDVHAGQRVDWRPDWKVFRDRRAATESGWNFSGRWFKTRNRSWTIRMTDILPVDLNTMLYHLESSLAKANKIAGKEAKANQFQQLAINRKTAINDLFWNEEKGIYDDYVFTDTTFTDRPSLAMMYPLYYHIATQEQADSVVTFFSEELLKSGGAVTSVNESRQRWDYPYGWAHLQWITVQALHHYGYDELSQKVADRWVRLNEKNYKSSGRFMEKYDVIEGSVNISDEELDNAIAYGWSIGVYLALKAYLGEKI